MEEYKYWFSIELENGQFDHIGNVVRKKIKEDTGLDDEVKKILLNYPVVYVHSWKSGDETKFYIGETIDIVRRTDEHEKMGEADDHSWQDDWISGKDHRSFFFSSPDMNKSLALDIEDCLMKRFACVNRRDNPQPDYSNKGKRDALLEQIINILKAHDIEPIPNSTTEKALHGSYMNDMAVYSTINIVNKIDGISMFTKPEEFPFQAYPVVYMHLWYDDKENLHTYVGETDDFQRRTEQHEDFFDLTDLNDENWHYSWQEAKNKMMLVFGHEEMNTSVTRDIEDLLIIYTKALGLSVNGRRNPQRDYDNRESMHPLFCKIVAFLNQLDGNAFLNQLDGNVFKSLDTLKKEAPFLASPLIELSDDQKKVKEMIVDEIMKASKDPQNKCQVLVISGVAGTGKTVIASSIFFDLCDKKISTRFVANQHDLMDIYKSQAVTRGLAKNTKTAPITSAQAYLNEVASDEAKKCDVVLVDEAHLLFWENYMGTVEEKQIKKLAQNCNVLVLMIDADQYVIPKTMWAVLTPENMIENFKTLLDNAADVRYLTDLTEQFRMNCSELTFDWIKSIPSEGKCEIEPFPYGKGKEGQYEYKTLSENGTLYAYEVIEKNNQGDTVYTIRIYDSLDQMAKDIEEKKKQDDPSALLASYCYDKKKDAPDDPWLKKFYWYKTATGNTNNSVWTLAPTLQPKKQNAFQVGSIFNIQGLDLNYAGVILGESFRVMQGGKKKGQICFDAANRIGLSTETPHWQTLIRNEINVLLTRGMKGLYIYAVDDKLREKLIEAVKKT